jgi:CRISPR/Cas system-associated exonuclease Cas4 (RecB family)
MKLLLTTSLLASIGFGSATALAQNAPPGWTNQGGVNRPAVMPPEAVRQAEANARAAADAARQAAMQAAGAAQAAAAAPGQPGAAPQVTNPALIQNQKMIQDIQRSVQEAQKKAEEEARRKAQMASQLVKPAMPQTPAQLAERAEAIKQNLAEAAPEVKAARQKEAQILAAKAAAARAAAQAQAAAAAAEANATKLATAALNMKKPNPALGVNFTTQNVTPLFQGLDNMTKGLAAIKTAADLPPPKLAALNQELARLMDYMGKVDTAMNGVSLAGVETAANKEAMTLYSRMPEFAKTLEAEMARVERLAPQAKPMFDKFRQ